MNTNNDIQTPQLITDDDIFNAARQLRNEENETLSVPTEMPSAMVSETASARVETLRPKRRWWAAAACFAGFLAGYGVNEGITRSSGLAETAESPVVQTIVQADTVLLREEIRDTVYLTRIVVREVASKGMVAQSKSSQSSQSSQSEVSDDWSDKPAGVGCSMLCDDIPYELLAGNDRY